MLLTILLLDMKCWFFWLCDHSQEQSLAHGPIDSAQSSVTSTYLCKMVLMSTEFPFTMRSCHDSAWSLLSDECPLQRLAFQIRFSDLESAPGMHLYSSCSRSRSCSLDTKYYRLQQVLDQRSIASKKRPVPVRSAARRPLSAFKRGGPRGPFSAYESSINSSVIRVRSNA